MGWKFELSTLTPLALENGGCGCEALFTLPLRGVGNWDSSSLDASCSDASSSLWPWEMPGPTETVRRDERVESARKKTVVEENNFCSSDTSIRRAPTPIRP